MNLFLHYYLLVAILLLSTACFSGGQVTNEIPTPVTYYVSPEGNDKNPGTESAPFQTVKRARDEIRNHRGKIKENVIVYLRGGTYFLPESLVFTPEDSGTSTSRRIYKAFPNEKPILSGGILLRDVKVDSQDRWNFILPEVKTGRWTFSQLFVNGQRRFRPKLPRQEYYKVKDALPPHHTPEVKIGPTGDDQFVYDADTFSTRWSNPTDIEVLAFHIWSASRLRVESIDAEKRIVRFTGPTYHSKFLALKKDTRYWIENVKEALSEPGQWYLDRPSGQLLYLPMEGESLDTTEIIAPRLSRLVELRGDEANHEWVEHIEFEGIAFAHSNYILPPEGQSIGQAEIILGGAIRGIGARHCALKDCTVRHTGSYAVEWSDGCQANEIVNCELTDLGAGGVKIGRQMLYGYDLDEPSSDHVVRNCLIAHGGRIHPGAVGILILSSPRNQIEHNEVFDFYYTGISVSMMGGEQYPNTWAHHNRIAFNHVYQIGQSVLSDLGGIYCMGVSPGTMITNNLVHDVQGWDLGNGIYLDEGSSYITVENNLCYDVSTHGFLQHYGRENRLRNNIFISPHDSAVRLARHIRGDSHPALILEQNILVTAGHPPVKVDKEYLEKPVLCSDRNLYWATDNPLPIFTKDFDLSQRQAQGQDRHSLFADPLFADLVKQNFLLRNASPAASIGFQFFDYTRAGRISSSP